MTTAEWVGRLEKRVENLENETAQNLSNLRKENIDMFKSIWEEINALKLANAKMVWTFGLVASAGTAILTLGLQLLAKKLGM